MVESVEDEGEQYPYCGETSQEIVAFVGLLALITASVQETSEPVNASGRQVSGWDGPEDSFE